MATLLLDFYCFFYRNISNNVYLVRIRDNCLLNCMLLNCILKPLCNQFGCSLAVVEAFCSVQMHRHSKANTAVHSFVVLNVLDSERTVYKLGSSQKESVFLILWKCWPLFKFQKDKKQPGDFSSLLFELKATGKFHTLTTSCVFYVVCL